jgi:hypothetical protein
VKAALAITVAVLGGAGVAAFDADRPNPAPPLETLLARASAYVERYKNDFALVISDEDYVQRVSGPRASREAERERRTRAEMLFMWLSDEHAWLTVRNVQSVDGRAVADGQLRFNQILSEIGDDPASRVRRLRRLRDETARYNLGSIVRNINFPTLALQFLETDMRPRFLFLLAGPDRIDGVPVWRVSYHERRRPTFIQGEAGAPRPASGAVWIAEADGAVLRSKLHLAVTKTQTSVAVTVDYRHDAKLQMWVPARMEESYVDGSRGRFAEKIECVAAYSNFRRFETSARIVP